MKTLFRILGTAAAVAVTGAAIVALDKILNQKDPLHVEEVEFPEEAEQDAAEAEKTAEAYAEAEAKAADDAAEPVLRQYAEQNPARAVQVLRPAVAGRVIQDDGQIRLSGAQQPLFDRFPRREAVGKADDGKIMRQRRTQQRAAAARGGEARDGLHLRLLRLAAQLIDQRGHAVDAAVAGADQADGLPCRGQLERHAAAFGLLRHGGGKQLFAGIAVLDQVDVDRVAHDHVARGQRAVGADGHIFKVAGADAHDLYLTQSVPPKVPRRRRRSRRPAPVFAPAAARRHRAPRAHRRYPRL